MAIGLGRLFGFHFPENFLYPYISKSVREFWQRWHISLSTWFRDYLYIPLGGSRRGRLYTYRNLILVFFLCGLWHGASWTFVAWGLYHGTFLVLERTPLKKLFEILPRFLGSLYTLTVVVFGWVLFRADSFPHALLFYKRLIGISESAVAPSSLALQLNFELIVLLLCGIIGSTPIALNLFKSFNHIAKEKLMLSAAYCLTCFAIMFSLLGFSAAKLASGTYNPFIYFRF